MKKEQITPIPDYFDRYLNQVADIELGEALSDGTRHLEAIPLGLWQAVGLKTYAPGKWTIHDMVQHLIDTERIFDYRALRFARKDQTELPGFAQDDFAVHTRAAETPLEDLVNDWKILRQSTLSLFRSFDEVMLKRTGRCNGREMSVLAIGFIIAGHQIHHLRIIEEKYLPLAARNG